MATLPSKVLGRDVSGLSPSFWEFLGSGQLNPTLHFVFPLCACLCPNPSPL